jgi:hypothetical protein
MVMKILLLNNSLALSRALQRYYQFCGAHHTDFLRYADLGQDLPNTFYDYDCYLIEIHDSKDQSSLPVGLHYGQLLDNNKKSVRFFFTHRPPNGSAAFSNCFYLPAQWEQFLKSVENLEKGTLADKLTQVSHSVQ